MAAKDVHFTSQVEFLKIVYAELDFILEHSSELDYEEFIQNESVKRSCLWSLLTAAEASKCISEPIKKKYAEQEFEFLEKVAKDLKKEWQQPNYELIWNLISRKLPELKIKIVEEIL